MATVFKPKCIGRVAVDSGVISVVDATHIKVNKAGEINLPSYSFSVQIK